MESEESSSSDLRSVLSILDSRSPATQLLVQQAGLPPEPSEGRTALSFRILEELLPRLGAYGPVLRLLRDQLHDDVYSQQLTCDASGGGSTYSTVPYYVLYRRLLDNRNVEAEEIRGQLDRVVAELQERCDQVGKLELAVGDFAEKEKYLMGRVKQLEAALVEREQRVQSAREHRDSELEESRTVARQCRDSLRHTKGQLQRLLGEKRSLLSYRECFDGLAAAFQFPAEENNGISSHEQPTSRQAVLASKKNHLLSDIETSRQLENQILSTRHQLVNEYDDFLDCQLQRRLMEDPREIDAHPEHVAHVPPPLPADEVGYWSYGTNRGCS